MTRTRKHNPLIEDLVILYNNNIPCDYLQLYDEVIHHTRLLKQHKQTYLGLKKKYMLYRLFNGFIKMEPLKDENYDLNKIQLIDPKLLLSNHKPFYRDVLAETLKSYIKSLNQYQQTRLDQRKLHKRIHQLCPKLWPNESQLFEPSKGETLVIDILDRMKVHYDLHYNFNHRWDHIRDQLPLPFDFYCVVIVKGMIIEFVIEFDGDQHQELNHQFFNYDLLHKHDLMKQVELLRIGISFIRFSSYDRDKIYEELEEFIGFLQENNDRAHFKNPISWHN